jgi:hypothetical protein
LLRRSGSFHIGRALRVLDTEKFCVIFFSLVTVSEDPPCFDRRSKQGRIGYRATGIGVVSLGSTAIGALNLFESGVLRHPE